MLVYEDDTRYAHLLPGTLLFPTKNPIKEKKRGFRVHAEPHCVCNFHSKPPTLYSLLLAPAQVISPFVLIKLLDLGALCEVVNSTAA